MEENIKKADLVIFLKQYNLWYRGMTLLEMRQCRQAIENSLSDNSLSSTNSSGEIAGKSISPPNVESDVNSELNYSYFRMSRYTVGATCSSEPTKMLESSPPSSCGERSPELARRFFVRADVHRPIDWSPSKDKVSQMETN